RRMHFGHFDLLLFARSSGRSPVSGFQQLRIDWQRPDAFAGCGVDRVADRGGCRRHARFADTARQMRVLDEIDVRLGRDIDARDEIIGVVALLDTAVFYGDLAVERIADAHDGSTFQLRPHPIGIDDRAAIDRHIESWYCDLAVIADGDMRDDGDVAQKTAVDGNPAALSRRQLLAPIAVRDGEVDDATQAPGVDLVIIGQFRCELIDPIVLIMEDTDGF